MADLVGTLQDPQKQIDEPTEKMKKEEQWGQPPTKKPTVAKLTKMLDTNKTSRKWSSNTKAEEDESIETHRMRENK